MGNRTRDNHSAKFTAGGNPGGKRKLIKCATLVIFIGKVWLIVYESLIMIHVNLIIGFVVSISTYYAKTEKNSKDSQGRIVYFNF